MRTAEMMAQIAAAPAGRRVTPTRVHDRVTGVQVAGALFVGASVGFLLVFSWLASHFGYPDVLDQRAQTVLPALLALGTTGRAVWALYAVLPLLLVPAVALATPALRRTDRDRGVMFTALGLQVISSLAMTIGLARWSTVQWVLAERVPGASAATRASMYAISDALNVYLGNGLGEFVGELTLYGVFAAMTVLLWRQGARRMSMLGALTTLAGWVGMFRNVSASVEPFASASNLLLPGFLIAVGVWMMQVRRAVGEASSTFAPSPAATAPLDPPSR